MRRENGSSITAERITRPEHGVVLVWALIFVILTSTMVMSHAAYMRSQRDRRETLYNADGLTSNFAWSGLRDTLGWFRRQSSQPVTEFAPRLEPDGDPPLFDTLDPGRGLVREFEIRGNLWGGYEVRKDEIADVSQQRASTAAGSVWDVVVRSYVYHRVDPNKAPGEAPNWIVSATSLQSELRGIPFRPPAPAALCVDDPGATRIGSVASVTGGLDGGVAFPDPGSSRGGGSPLGATVGPVQGAPALLASGGWDSAPEAVFAMDLDELRELADYVWHGKYKFDKKKPLDGKVVYATGGLEIKDELAAKDALIVVEGDLSVVAAKPKTFKGVVYVTGNAVVAGPFTLQGSLIVRGTLDLGRSGSAVDLTYDPIAIERVREEIIKYRLRRTVRPKE